MSLENKKIYVVGPKNTTQRLDLFINDLYPSLSRSQIQKMIKSELITVNKNKARASLSLNLNDSIQIGFNTVLKKESTAFQQEIFVETIFEDDDLIVVNKPIDLVTHPGAGNPEGTLVNAFFDKLFKNDPIRPGVVHRLDKDTSGLLVLAKTKAAFESLSDQFKNKDACRIYWALVFGKLKTQTGTLKTYLSRNPKDRKKFSSQEAGKIAITHYKVLKEGLLSLVELSLETGRTHQIRVHLSENGHPILNDSIYSSRKKINDIKDPVLKSKAKKLKRLALVAKELNFKHPITGQPLAFKVPWPHELEII